MPEYLQMLLESVPDDRRLVHNHIRHSTRTRAGVNGFRFWLEESGGGTRLTPCDCGWAPGLGTHFRVEAVL